MTEDADAQFFKAPSFLKAKVGEIAPKLPADIARKLDGEIEQLQSVYHDIYDAEVAQLRAACAEASGPMLDGALIERVYPVLHRIRGEAGMGGLALASSVADAICRVIEDESMDGRVPVSLLQLHVDALRVIRQLPDDAQAVQGVVTGLAKARDKVLGN